MSNDSMSSVKIRTKKQMADENWKNKVTQLPTRHFRVLNDSSKRPTVRFMSWNILAQALCKADDVFHLCPDEAIEWSHRKPFILAEIFRVNPTVLCMQEMDKFTELEAILTTHNYKGLFFPKPDSPCLDMEDHSGPDGCCIFYRSDKLELSRQTNMVLVDKYNRKTNQVAVVCNFQILNSQEQFTVVCTHLKAKTGYEALRAQQGQCLLEFLQRSTTSQLNRPVVVCGDFNAKPSEQIYKEFSESDLGLKSAYLAFDGREPDYTSWKIRHHADLGQTESCKTIDYIWYSRDSLEVQSLFMIPSEKDIGANRLPSSCYPSDHISLACDLSFL